MNDKPVRLRDAVVLTDSAGQHTLLVKAADGTATMIAISREQYRAVLDATAGTPRALGTLGTLQTDTGQSVEVSTLPDGTLAILAPR
jgi:hypothetical protein